MSLLRELARRTAVQALGSRPAVRLRLRRLRRADPLVILNFHRVALPDGSAFRPLDPARFDELLRFASRHFSLVTFERAQEPAPRPRMILSFDDGYRDFVEVAMPLLARYGIRANQNVIPACVESGLPPLQVLAADFLGKAPPEIVAKIDIPGFDMRDPRRRWQRLDRHLGRLTHSEQSALQDRLLPQLFAWEGFRPTPMMNREEVRQAAAEHEIGAHSFDHASMAGETDDYLRADVHRCRAWIKAVTGAPMRIYAFPNGSHRPGQPEAALAAGAEHVLLAGGSLGARGRIYDRVGIKTDTRAELRFRALGAHAPIRSASGRQHRAGGAAV